MANPQLELFPNTTKQEIIQGDCLQVMRGMPENSIDFVVCDPPYGINFMNRQFDRFKDQAAFNSEYWKEALRICKPGAMLAAFGGSRTHHHLMMALEQAGWEIRDVIMWIYGSGFPKSLDVSKAIDKRGGNPALVDEISDAIKKERESKNLSVAECDDKFCGGTTNWSWFEGRPAGKRLPSDETFKLICDEWPDLYKYFDRVKDVNREVIPTTGNLHKGTGNTVGCFTGTQKSNIPITKLSEKFSGYGTALKPAYEPILICKKPYEISDLFAIILLDITNEVYQCQKSNYYVNDAEENLSDSLLLLDRVHQSIVQDHAKTYAWEKLSDVQYVIKNAMSLVQELNEKINQEKELFALMHAKQNGNLEGMQVRQILSGEAECIFAGIQGIVTFATKEHIEQNIVSLWKHILAGILQGMSNFTTRTVINLITELRILKSCLHPITSNDIGDLSPSYEPIIIAMKPLDGTFAQNAEKWGVAGINIDESRIGSEEIKTCAKEKGDSFTHLGKGEGFNGCPASIHKGRWPANLILSEEAAQELDEMTGVLKSGSGNRRPNGGGNMFSGIAPMKAEFESSSGGASRFFYCAKASSSERNRGLEGLPLKFTKTMNDGIGVREHNENEPNAYKQNIHPTVKPIALMKYILKLLAPPGNPTCLDPFCGSGSTLCAAKELDISCIGIEKEDEYCEIARRRVEGD